MDVDKYEFFYVEQVCRSRESLKIVNKSRENELLWWWTRTNELNKIRLFIPMDKKRDCMIDRYW